MVLRVKRLRFKEKDFFTIFFQKFQLLKKMCDKDVFNWIAIFPLLCYIGKKKKRAWEVCLQKKKKKKIDQFFGFLKFFVNFIIHAEIEKNKYICFRTHEIY